MSGLYLANWKKATKVEALRLWRACSVENYLSYAGCWICLAPCMPPAKLVNGIDRTHSWHTGGQADLLSFIAHCPRPKWLAVEVAHHQSNLSLVLVCCTFFVTCITSCLEESVHCDLFSFNVCSWLWCRRDRWKCVCVDLLGSHIDQLQWRRVGDSIGSAWLPVCHLRSLQDICQDS